MSGPSAFVFYIENGFGKSGYVYEKSLLNATRDFLAQGKVLESPKDVRESIETVYLEENVNRLKAIRQSQQADMVSIGKVNCKDFWRLVQLTSLRNDPHTRQEGLPSTNIILISDDQQRRFENGEPLSSIELREIVKTQMYSSVPIKKLDGIERIETNNPYLDEYCIYNKSQFQVSDELGLQL
jgi:hypothetical protein